MSTLWQVLTEPVFRDVLPSLFNLVFRKHDVDRSKIRNHEEDISAGEYWARLFGGRGMVDKVLSAVVHGITGGDVWKLSMGSGPFAPALGVPTTPAVGHAVLRQEDYELMATLTKDKATFDLANQYKDADAIWFRDGFSTLTNALAASLRNNPNVTIKTGEPVESVRYLQDLDRVAVGLQSLRKPLTSSSC